MRYDTPSGLAVACQAIASSLAVAGLGVGLATSCGPKVAPLGPGPGESATVAQARQSATPGAHNPGRQIVIGEMCPSAAAGRPAVDPLFVRGARWDADAGVLADLAEHNAVAEFVVLGFDGRRAGVFTAMGAADVPGAQTVVAGSYVGESPCAVARASAGAAHATNQGASQMLAAEDQACMQAQKGCGLAIGEVGSPGTTAVATAAANACVVNQTLRVDVDGDGRFEGFALADAFDSVGVPHAEWLAKPAPPQACPPQFAVHNLALAAPLQGTTVDVLGVLDLDLDGRSEVVLAVRYAKGRAVMIFSPRATASRLELVGEAQSVLFNAP